VLTLCAASLAFRFVEAPAIRLGHRLAARRERQHSPNRGAMPGDAEPATI
jgi:peptidoglycan/LPS O-acetylase OafA/YrhL